MLRINLYSKDWASFCFKMKIVFCGHIFVLMPLVSFGFYTRNKKSALPIYVYGGFNNSNSIAIAIGVADAPGVRPGSAVSRKVELNTFG